MRASEVASRSTTTCWCFGCDKAEHNRNTAGMLERAREKGITLKLSKSSKSVRPR